jgi:hypothetical protein
MADYFFYGTLLDATVRLAVLGRRLPAGRCRPASLPGWRRVHRRGAAYPVLVADPGQAVDGLLVTGLGAAAAARLARFEGPDYRLAALPVVVTDGAAPVTGCVMEQVFIPASPAIASDRPWSFAVWAARDRAAFLARIRPAGVARP